MEPVLDHGSHLTPRESSHKLQLPPPPVDSLAVVPDKKLGAHDGGRRRKEKGKHKRAHAKRNHQIGKQQQQQLLLGTDRDRCSVRMDGASVVPRSQYQVLSHDYKG
uniref:Uncharacterized protein n=1 Tax=Oryza rufipogon TaxID=4529 RepID=A0A0E0PFI8_ORYRU